MMRVKLGLTRAQEVIAMRKFDYATGYSRGYTDSRAWGCPYRDGCTPEHRLTLIVPGCIYKNKARAGYRDGWQAGKAVQTT